MFFWPFHAFFLWWLFGKGIMTLIVLVLIIWWFTHARRHPYGGYHFPGPGGWQRSSALGILEERYARGEIQRDEYLQKRNDFLNRGL